MSVSLFVINYNVFVPLIARDVLHEGAHGFGLLMSALGLGAMTGALALALLGVGRPPLRMIVAPALVVCAGTLALASVRDFRVALALLALVGCAQIVFTSNCNSTVQLTVPDALRGRLMGLYALVFVGVTPIGSFFVGTTAEHLGVSTACAIAGSAGLASVVALTLGWRWRRRRLRSG
jgi:predicted MFS family arabinose efflux permease